MSDLLPLPRHFLRADGSLPPGRKVVLHTLAGGAEIAICVDPTEVTMVGNWIITRPIGTSVATGEKRVGRLPLVHAFDAFNLFAVSVLPDEEAA